MQAADAVFWLPHAILALGAVTVMLGIAFYRNYTLTFVLTLAALAGSLIVLPLLPETSGNSTTLFVWDPYTLFYSFLMIASTAAAALISYEYLKDRPGIREEYFLLLLLACLGSIVLAGSNHFVSFFLGLELLSVSLFTLISYQRLSDEGLEAGIKYLVLAGASSAFLLFGMALLYFATATMRFEGLAAVLGRSGGLNLVSFAGTGMILVGIGFKLGVVPFHMWTADVYEGSPTPVTAFIATVSKGSIFALLVRYFGTGGIEGRLLVVFTIFAVASMLIGNLLALFQNNVKRILAYSSIAHMGYALVAFLSAGPMRVSAVTFYLLTYFISVMGAFGVVTALSGTDSEADRIANYRGLFAKSPWLTFLFSLFLLSLAGLPLTAGFVGKFYVIRAGVGSARWLLVVSLIAGSAIGLFYYLRVLTVMFMPETSEYPSGSRRINPLQTATLTALAGGLVWLGLNPGGILRVIGSLVMGGVGKSVRGPVSRVQRGKWPKGQWGRKLRLSVKC